MYLQKDFAKKNYLSGVWGYYLGEYLGEGDV